MSESHKKKIRGMNDAISIQSVAKLIGALDGVIPAGGNT